MKDYSEEFKQAKACIEKLEEQLQSAKKVFREHYCPHVYLDGKSAIRPSTTHSNCEICGISTYDLGV